MRSKLRIMQICVRTMQIGMRISCSRTARSSPAAPSAPTAWRPARPASRPRSAGYEQAVTDPSYARQVLAFASPLVGNYGVDEARLESGRVWTEGVVMRRARPAWSAWLAARGVVALEEVDTRALVRRLRENGAMRCALGTAPPEELHARALARAAPRLAADARRAGARLAATGARGVRARAVRGRRRAARRRARLRLQALDRPPPRRVRRRGRRRARHLGGGRGARARARRRPRRQRAGRSGAARPGRSRRCAGCSAACRSSASASGTSSSGSRSGCETFKLPFGHRGANHPGAGHRHEARARDRAEPRLRRRARRRRRGEPRLAQRRHGRGARGRRLRHAPVPSRGRARPARRPALLRPDRRPRAETHRSTQHPDRRLRADPDRPGLRVRLRGRPGLPRAAGGGLPRRARELEPGHDHDRPGVGGRDLPRAARRAHAGRDRRARAAGRAPAHAGRPDSAQPRGRAGGERRARRARRRADRSRPGRDPDRGGSLPASGRRWRLPGCPCRRASSSPRSTQLDGCPVPAVVRPAFTLGGRGGGIARTRDELRERVAHGLAASPIGQVLVERSLEGWQEFELEVVVRHGRQLHRRLLDREPRPGRRAHGRLVDGGAAADARRRRAAAAARRGVRLRARRRRGDGRRERPVRVRAGDTASWR